MSTSPFWMNDSRLADTVSTNSMASASMPSFAAMSVAISTSKPSGTPLGFSRPNPGWSNLVPTVMAPASERVAMVEPSGNSTSVATSAVFSEASAASLPASLPPHPVRTTANAARPAA